MNDERGEAEASPRFYLSAPGTLSMTVDDALQFLRNYTVMTDAQKSSCAQLYDDVRKFFCDHPDEACIPLFLHSFGNTKKCAFGVYQLVEDLMIRFPATKVVPQLRIALQIRNRDILYWSAQIAVNFPDPSLVEELAALVENEDSDIRFASITAVEQIGGDRVTAILRKALAVERDAENRNILKDALSNR